MGQYALLPGGFHRVLSDSLGSGCCSVGAAVVLSGRPDGDECQLLVRGVDQHYGATARPRRPGEATRSHCQIGGEIHAEGYLLTTRTRRLACCMICSPSLSERLIRAVLAVFTIDRCHLLIIFLS